MANKKTIRIDPEIKDLLPEFLKNRKKDIELILSLIDKNEFSKISDLAHKMKGSGKLYSFDHISEIGYSFEQAAQKKDSEQIKKLCSQLNNFLDNIEVK